MASDSPATEHGAGRATGLPAHPRRCELLLAVTALAALLRLPSATAAAGIGVAEFRDLSIALTGYAPRDQFLPGQFLPGQFLGAFAAEAEELGRLHAILRSEPAERWEAAIEAAALAELAQALIGAWYTGMVGEGPEQRVISYLDAFVWHACGFTKPPGKCDTDFGAWAEQPPQGQDSG
jgi:hypothetical protein